MNSGVQIRITGSGVDKHDCVRRAKYDGDVEPKDGTMKRVCRVGVAVTCLFSIGSRLPQVVTFIDCLM